MSEFNKTLIDGTFRWYNNLKKGSIKNWDDIKSQFNKKFFNVQKQVTMVELVRLGQRVSEDLLYYMICSEQVPRSVWSQLKKITW